MKRIITAMLIVLIFLISCETAEEEQEEKWHTEIMTTYFYVGEAESGDNAFIPNDMSAYDEKWLEHYGGIDSPENRNGYYPAGFIPKENPFYFSLPYFDPSNKNKWIAIRHRNIICYAQWEDIGPYETDDYNYVYEFAEPENQFGVKAGLDISPAVWDCLGMADNDYVDWRFASEEEIPEGPWKEITTTSGVYYG